MRVTNVYVEAKRLDEATFVRYNFFASHFILLGSHRRVLALLMQLMMHGLDKELERTRMLFDFAGEEEASGSDGLFKEKQET